MVRAFGSYFIPKVSKSSNRSPRGSLRTPAVIIAFVSFLLTIPRTFEKVSYISFVSVTSILIAVLITIIASGVQSIDTLQEATGKNLGPVEWHASEHHSLVDTIGAITNSE